MSVDIVAPNERTLPELADVANREHRLAREAAVSMVEHAVCCGEALAAVKAQLPHGAWLPWLDANFEASARTAQNFMRLAANTQRVAHLPEASLRQAIEAVSPRPASSRDETRDLAAAAMRALQGAPKISRGVQTRRYKAWRIEQFSKREIRALPFVQELQARLDELEEENQALRRELALRCNRRTERGSGERAGRSGLSCGGSDDALRAPRYRVGASCKRPSAAETAWGTATGG